MYPASRSFFWGGSYKTKLKQGAHIHYNRYGSRPGKYLTLAHSHITRAAMDSCFGTNQHAGHNRRINERGKPG